MNRYRTRKRTVTKNAPVWKWQHVTPRRKTRRKHTTFDSSRSILFRSRSVLLETRRTGVAMHARRKRSHSTKLILVAKLITWWLRNEKFASTKLAQHVIPRNENDLRKGGITLVLVSLPDQSRNWWSMYTFTSRCALRISNPLFRMQITRGDCSFFETTVTVPFL